MKIIGLTTLIISAFIVGCSDSTSPAADGQLTLSTRYTSQAVLAKTSGGTAVDSVRITRARLVLRDIKFKTAGEDSLNFRSQPIVLELSLAGAVQQVGLATVPFGTYSRIEFDVHRVESPEIAALPSAEQAAFADFLAGERYSIIIDGTVYRTGLAATSFSYRSKVDAKQKIDLSPALVVDQGTSEANSTLLVSSSGWFQAPGGGLVDPTDTNNEGVIDENLKASIRVFKDNNRDGTKD